MYINSKIRDAYNEYINFCIRVEDDSDEYNPAYRQIKTHNTKEKSIIDKIYKEIYGIKL